MDERKRNIGGGQFVVSTRSGKQWFGWCPDCRPPRARGNAKHPYRREDAWRTSFAETPADAEALLRAHWESQAHRDAVRTISVIEQLVGAFR